MADAHHSCRNHIPIRRGVVYCPRTQVVYGNARVALSTALSLENLTAWEAEWFLTVIVGVNINHPDLCVSGFMLCVNTLELPGMNAGSLEHRLREYYARSKELSQ